MSQYYFVLQSLRKALPSTTLYYKACTKYILYFFVLQSCTKHIVVLLCTTKLARSTSLLCTTKLAQSTSQYYFALQSLHKAQPTTTLHYKACTNHVAVLLWTAKLTQSIPQSSTTLYYKACTKHVPVLLCTTKFAQSTSQYYFVLQSLHKARPRTTLYYKACTIYFPVPLCTAKLAQSTSQYYFVLQSLDKVHPGTTLYYKACTRHVPVPLCTTRLAQIISSTTLYYKACTKHVLVLLYFVLRSLRKAYPNTTLYYKSCTKHFPVLLCTTKLAQSSSQYYFVLQTLHKALPSTTLYYKACTCEQNMTTIMQPLRCDLQPKIQQAQRPTDNHPLQNTKRNRLPIVTIGPVTGRQWKVPRVRGGCGPFVLVRDWFLDGVLQCVVRRVCVALGRFGICGCRSHCQGCMIVVMFCCHVRIYMRVCNAALQQCILVWLHGCCMGLVLGRKPEHETLCFSV